MVEIEETVKVNGEIVVKQFFYLEYILDNEDSVGKIVRGRVAVAWRSGETQSVLLMNRVILLMKRHGV